MEHVTMALQFHYVHCIQQTAIAAITELLTNIKACMTISSIWYI